ncbi:MAG: NAD(+) synthase, partial [Clostridia bacterium]|nr:NAD(+) synthase [Clostridia bacterium]
MHHCSHLRRSLPFVHPAQGGRQCPASLSARNGRPSSAVGGWDPLAYNGRLYSCAAVCSAGELLGIVPRVSISAADELNGARWFSQAPETIDTLNFSGTNALFGANLNFRCENLPDLCVAVELGDTLFTPDAQTGVHAAAGAAIIVNPAASPEIIGRAAARRRAVEDASARYSCAMVYANAGRGESTTDLVFAGHNLIAENGRLLAERQAFASDDYVATEIDLDRISAERRRNPLPAPTLPVITSAFTLPVAETKLTRHVNPHPFIPEDPAARAERCREILTIQAEGLRQRIECAFARTCVIGISGGLDSCLALLVTAKAMDLLGRPRTDITAVTMPCFGTTSRTKSNAELLCAALGVNFRTVDIMAAVNQHFADIGHDPSNHNVVYENSQARERTQIIMDIANAENGLVIGTGDLSELALGWATYNGDHMSMYGVNGSVPKTLVRHIVGWYADAAEADGNAALAACLRDILATPVSPELLPPKDGEIAQITEDLVGPYELHDFYLYWAVRCGFPPRKLFRLARHAFASTYDDATLLRWLETFFRRFISQQFKRSCLPDGP